MNRNDVLILVSTEYGQDMYGIPVEVSTQREVFCWVNSVTRQEFFDAGRNGINPSFMFTVFEGDYNDEQTVIYNGKAYSVYRTYYDVGNYVELYVTRKGGTNVKNTD